MSVVAMLLLIVGASVAPALRQCGNYTCEEDLIDYSGIDKTAATLPEVAENATAIDLSPRDAPEEPGTTVPAAKGEPEITVPAATEAPGITVPAATEAPGITAATGAPELTMPTAAGAPETTAGTPARAPGTEDTPSMAEDTANTNEWKITVVTGIVVGVIVAAGGLAGAVLFVMYRRLKAAAPPRDAFDDVNPPEQPDQSRFSGVVLRKQETVARGLETPSLSKQELQFIP